LYTEGAIELRHSGRSGLDFFDQVDTSYGTEENGIVPLDDDEGVEVPECQFYLSDEHLSQLQETVNPLQSSENYGIELYEQTLGFITLIVGQNPTMYH